MNTKLSFSNCQLFCFSIILLLFFAFPVKSQVTIGSLDPPHSFSILELIAKNHDGGLRLPLLSTDEREDLKIKDLVGDDAETAKGLVIFNTTTNCLEFWNGEKWISMCSDALVDCSTVTYPELKASYDFLTGATIANLIADIGGNVKLYDAPIDGNLYDNPSTLLNPALTYYAEQRVSNCSRRVPVAVTISTAAVSGTALIDACVTAMYDFQYQTLTAYGVNNAAQWQWYARRRGEAEYQPIHGATAVSYTIPANFAKNVFQLQRNESGANYTGNDSIQFKVEVWNARTTTRISSTIVFDVEFIDTYGNDYVALKAPDDIESNHNTGGVIKFAYLNLGQDRDSNGTQNACDFGSLYQWGRVTDGHEKIIWTKDANRNIAFDAVTKDNQINVNDVSTSDFNNTPTVSNLEGGTTTWQVLSDSPAYGEFIYGSNYWNSYKAANTDFWATSSYAKTSNDPCPSGWHVPTRYEFGAIFQGTPSTGDPRTVTTLNAWTWRPNTTISNHVQIAGGYIVTYGDGSNKSRRIFMPAASSRFSRDGTLLYGSDYAGCYWSSTIPYGSLSNANYLLLYGDPVNLVVDSDSPKAYGFSVRCVKE